MALEINNIDGVICLKGNVSSSRLHEITGYFESVLTYQNTVHINLCQIKEGSLEIKRALDSIKEELSEDKTINYYGHAEAAVKKLYAQINDPSNFYQAA